MLTVDVDADPDAARRLAEDRDAWPTVLDIYGGRAPLPVALACGADRYLWFTPDALRSDWCRAQRIQAAAGADAVSADEATPETVAACLAWYGSFFASYDLEWWYAPFAGPRRRVLAVLLPDRAACAARFPAVPEEDRVCRSIEEAARGSRAAFRRGRPADATESQGRLF